MSHLRDCRASDALSLTLSLDAASIDAVRRADVTLSCSNCGGEILRTDQVPVDVTYREEPAHATRRASAGGET
ncbi:hypothetical protein [Actinomadura sp. GTD37]|uniref:hypothetical protein n=1 Tax=Actinomadura sp. GTD37 TaxID=1778030 RepID=UPI0035C0F0C7